jgi:hypothetical protein
MGSQKGAMANYTSWRNLEQEFRQLQVEYPELLATSYGIDERWAIRGAGRERFESLAGIAAAEAGEQAVAASWLNLLKTYLLDRDSDSISHSVASDAAGLAAETQSEPEGDRWWEVPIIKSDDPRIKQFNIYTIRSLYKMSADYCLERARQARTAITTPMVDRKGSDAGALPKEPHEAKRGRGPIPGYETARRVAAVVTRSASDGQWKAKLDEICIELDEEQVPRPKTWKSKGYGDWFDCLAGNRPLVVKAIQHHLSLAQRTPKTLA